MKIKNIKKKKKKITIQKRKNIQIMIVVNLNLMKIILKKMKKDFSQNYLTNHINK